jgi:hypothetical protein
MKCTNIKKNLKDFQMIYKKKRKKKKVQTILIIFHLLNKY